MWTVEEFQLSSGVRQAQLACHAASGLMVLAGSLLLALIAALLLDLDLLDGQELWVGVVVVAFFMSPMPFSAAHAVWAVRGRRDLFAQAEARPQVRPTDQQLLDHVTDEYPWTWFWGQMSVWSGIATLVCVTLSPFALFSSPSDPVAGAILSVLAGVSLVLLVLSVRGVRRAGRLGRADTERRRQLWPAVPASLNRKLAGNGLGGGDAGAGTYL